MRSAVLMAVLLLIPVTAHGEQATTWSFLGGKVPGSWHVNGPVSVQPQMEGLRITASGPAVMTRTLDIPHGVDALELLFMGSRDTAADFLWHAPGTPDNEFIILPFTLPRSMTPTTVTLNLAAFKQWNDDSDIIGFRFPEGTDIQLLHMRFRDWNLLENIREAWKSYWTFDRYLATTVNFLWGPQLAFTPVAREAMFHTAPPQATSANRVMYALLMVGLVAAILYAHTRRAPKEAFLGFAALTAGVWILSDIRMGAETLSYAWRDYRTYVSRPLAEREFRERGRFYAFAELAAPLLTQEEAYAFYSFQPAPFVGFLRYATFPALPVWEGSGATIDTWVVYAREDIRLGSGGRLMLGGKAISPPGAMLLQFPPGSFVFRAHP